MTEANNLPGHDINAPTNDPADEPMPVLKLVSQLRQGVIDARNLSLEDRRAAVSVLVAEGYSSHEIAMILKLSDRTIERDRAAIRKAYAVQPDNTGADQMIGELKRQAELALHRLQRAVRDRADGPPVTPHHRIRAALHCYYIYDRLTRTLLHAKYILDGQARDNAKLIEQWQGDLAEVLRANMSANG